MYAIVDIAGKQFKAEKGKYLNIPLRASDDKVVCDTVLLVDDGKKVSVGMPTLKNIEVRCKVLTHGKGEKVIVFKKKRRKGYAVKNGHKQPYTRVLVESIGVAKTSSPKTATKAPTTKTAAKTASPQATIAKTAAKTVSPQATTAKTTAAKAAQPRKTAPKKSDGT